MPFSLPPPPKTMNYFQNCSVQHVVSMAWELPCHLRTCLYSLALFMSKTFVIHCTAMPIEDNSAGGHLIVLPKGTVSVWLGWLTQVCHSPHHHRQHRSHSVYKVETSDAYVQKRMNIMLLHTSFIKGVWKKKMTVRTTKGERERERERGTQIH